MESGEGMVGRDGKELNWDTFMLRLLSRIGKNGNFTLYLSTWCIQSIARVNFPTTATELDSAMAPYATNCETMSLAFSLID